MVERIEVVNGHSHTEHDLLAELGVEGREFVPPKDAADGALIAVGAADLHGSSLLDLYGLHGLNQRARRASIGANQAALSQLRAAEIPHDDEHHVSKFGTVDVIENGHPGGTAGLTIVGDSKSAITHAEAPSEAVMARIGVEGADLLDEGQGFVYTADRGGVDDEAGALDRIDLEGCWPGQC